MAEPILTARSVHVHFDTSAGRVEAVKNVNLDIYPGETLAIVGESGAGKSAFAKAILHLHQLPFTQNRTHISGEITLQAPFVATLSDASPEVIRKVRAKAIGMIFQDALSALNPVQRIAPQIAESILQADPKLPELHVDAQVMEIIRAIGLPDTAARAYPHQLSGGQCQRVVIAIAAVRYPVALIADEPTTALDVTIQAQILKLLKSLQDARGMAMLFISHDLGVVVEIADRVAVMCDGEIVECREAAALFSAPEHPYTKSLLASRPAPRRAPVDLSGGILTDGSKPVIEVEQLSFGYGGGILGKKFTNTVLHDVSLTVKEGDVHGLVGESGSGKSTLGRLILGFLNPTSGKVQALGQEPQLLRGDKLRAFRRHVQIIYQDSATALNPRLSLGRSAAEGLEIQGLPRGDIKSEVARLFDLVHLPQALLDRYPHEVSGGQRQRVCIARALATRPRVLIADEPVTALDISVQARILDLFAELQAELALTMLFISHDLGVIRALCDHVTVLQNGRVAEAGDTCTVFNQPATKYTQTLIQSIPGERSAKEI